MSHQHNPDIPPNSTKYFSNARGFNYYPPMAKMWDAVGHIPRAHPDLLAGAGYTASYNASDTFVGSNKTAMWRYYDSEENEKYLSILKEVGTNCIRVFTDYYYWLAFGDSHLDDVKDLLRICDKLKIRCQLVLWDGIDIYGPLAVGGTADTITSADETTYIRGLSTSWQKIPHEFEFSSTAQADDFFANRATPFLDALVPAVSSYQSLWSFDVQNELDNEIAQDHISKPTFDYLASAVSSVGIKTTWGHGAGYDYSMKQLSDQTGGSLGDVGACYNFSAYADFVSIHPYSNTKFSRFFYINDSISGAQETGYPFMYNEGSDTGRLSFPYTVDSDMRSKGIGGMKFDAFVDRAQSSEPFLINQGMFYEDGQVRMLEDASSFVNMAIEDSWTPSSFLKTVHVEKSDTSENPFVSGTQDITVSLGALPDRTMSSVPDFIANYSTSYSGITEEDWEANKYLYDFLVTGNSKAYNYNLNKSWNYSPIQGDPMCENSVYSWTASGINMGECLNRLYAVSSLTNLSSISDPYERNEAAAYRTMLAGYIAYSTFERPVAIIPRPDLFGTDFDYNVACASSLRSDFSAVMSHLEPEKNVTNNTNESYDNSIAPNDIRFRSGTQTIQPGCHNTSTCIYSDGDYDPVLNQVTVGTYSDPPNLNWEAYDKYYNNLFDKLRDCVDAHQNYGASTDPDFELF